MLVVMGVLRIAFFFFFFFVSFANSLNIHENVPIALIIMNKKTRKVEHQNVTRKNKQKKYFVIVITLVMMGING